MRLSFRSEVGSGSSGEVLIPCFLIMARISSELVGENEVIGVGRVEGEDEDEEKEEYEGEEDEEEERKRR